MTLVLCLRDGSVLGALPAFPVAVPWWPEAAPVVAAARAAHGVNVTILRLLSGEADRVPAGGRVTYLAEVESAPRGLAPWAGEPNADEPLRLPYARPGGPAMDLAWADAELERCGTPRTAPAVQIRTWNLSSIWRLPLEGSSAWLKVVPPFFAHEGLMISLLESAAVPRLIAADGTRILLEEIPGPERHHAAGAPLLTMVGILVSLQLDWIGREEELIRLGLPDWRAGQLADVAADLLSRTAAELEPCDVRVLMRLLDGLGERVAAVSACGIPDSLVHGDFHRGNVRGPDDRLVLLDWGDCGVGHPLLDQAAFLDRMPAPDRAAVSAEWTNLWRAAAPASDPDRAARLLEPVAALRQAVIYRGFLDAIEPDERVYHAADPAAWLTRAADLAR